MAEQIMWAVKEPGDEGRLLAGFGLTPDGAWGNVEDLYGLRQSNLELQGCRCIRVKVVEVEDA